MFIRGTIKTYPNRQLQQIVVFKDGFKTGCYCTTELQTSKIHIPYRNINYCHLHNPNKTKKNTKKNEIQESSLRRSKTKVLDYALSNTFDLFITLTIDPDKIDSLDHDLTKYHLEKWLYNIKYKSPDLKYIIVPELHKSGRLHFHGLFKNYNGKLKQSYTKNNKIRVDKSKRNIYNLEQYKIGFSTAVKIDDSPATAYYITKYMKKDFQESQTLNKKRYWASRNLAQPITFNFSDTQQVPQIKDLSLTLISMYRGEYYTKYTRSTVLDYINETAIVKRKKPRYTQNTTIKH